MKNRNSTNQDRFTPDEIIQIYGIKKTTYYDRLKFLGIKAQKDEEGKAYLDLEQAELLEKLDEHVKSTGKMEGFEFEEVEYTQPETEDNSSAGGQLAVKESDNDLAVSSNDNWAPQPDSIIEQEIPQKQTDYSEGMDELIRKAAEIKAQNLAMPELIALQISSQMTYEDLPEDLQEKVNEVREAASPKMKPANIASQLLAQHRANRK